MSFKEVNEVEPGQTVVLDEPKEKKKVFAKIIERIKKRKPKEENKEEKKDKPKGRTSDKWWDKYFNPRRMRKSNRVAAVFLRNNGNADLLEVQSRNGFFNIEGKSYHEDKDCIYTITKDRIPLLIIREWDLLPLGTKRSEEDSMREKFAELENHVLKGIRHAELVKSGGTFDDKKISMKQAIVWGIIGIVLVAIALNYI